LPNNIGSINIANIRLKNTIMVITAYRTLCSLANCIIPSKTLSTGVDIRTISPNHMKSNPWKFERSDTTFIGGNDELFIIELGDDS